MDLDTALENLKLCLNTTKELSKMEPQTKNEISSDENTPHNEPESLDFKYDDYLFRLILNNSIFIDNAFSNSKITHFLAESCSMLSSNESSKKYFQIYLDKFLTHLKQTDKSSENILQSNNLDFVTELSLDRSSFNRLVDNLYEKYTNNAGEQLNSDEFNFFTNMLLKNQAYLFENDLNIYDELGALNDKHISSLKTLTKSLKLLLLHLAKSEYSEAGSSKKDDLVDLLLKSFEYKPALFKLVFKLTSYSIESKNKLPKNLKKFAAKSQQLLSVFESCYKETDFMNGSNGKSSADSDLESMLKVSNSIDKLKEKYTHTMSKSDQSVLKKLFKLEPSLNCLMFKLMNEASETSTADILNKQAKITDFISFKLDDSILSNTIFNYPISRKLEDLAKEDLIEADAHIYDPIYLIPNMFNLLNYGNFFNLVQSLSFEI